MFGWLRRSEGFEWHKYVRTTIKLRRDNRRARVRDAGRAVRHHGKAAGVAVVDLGGAAAVAAAAGAKDAARLGAHAAKVGVVAAASGAKVAARKGAQAAVVGAQAAAHGAGVAGRASLAGSDRLARWTGAGVLASLGLLLRGIGPTWRMLVHPRIGGPLGLVGLLALMAFLSRVAFYRLDAEAVFVGLIAAIALGAAHLPRLMARPEVPRTVILRRISAVGEKAGSERGQRLAGILVLALLIAGSLWWLGGSQERGRAMRVALPGLPSLSLPSISLPSLSMPSLSLPSLSLPQLPGWPFGSTELAGRASTEGETIVVRGQRLRLTGIEMPMAEQLCRRGDGKTWRCGRTAAAQLARAVDGRTLTCSVGGSAGENVRSATCMAGDKDIAQELVRQGAVFAAAGWFATYRSEQSAAQAAKAGLWSGEAERPAAYRERIWSAAAKAAPNGCPIKGSVRSGRKTYLMPWSAAYVRERITPSRGEKWFCSESEAAAAGFRAE